MFSILQITRLSRLCCLAAAVAVGVVPGRAQQVAAGDLELAELKTTLETSARQIRELDAQLSASRLQVATLTQSLAGANAEAAASKEQFEKLREVVEGLGISAINGSPDDLQNKLLTALSDLRISDEQRRESVEALVSLSEAALLFAKDPTSAPARAALESTLKTVDKVVGQGSSDEATAAESDLHTASVLSWKPEASLAVLNVGSRQGVRVGMPFTIYRQDQPVAQVVVVDVRKSISGVVVQESLSRNLTPAVGDRGQINPNRAF